jgi:hypothetical protein
MDKQTKQEIWLFALGTSPSRRPSRFAALAILTCAEGIEKGRNRLGNGKQNWDRLPQMRIVVAFFALMLLTGCAGDRLKAPTKCDAVSAVVSNPSATRDQVAAAMEMGRNNGCFGEAPRRH